MKIIKNCSICDENHATDEAYQRGLEARIKRTENEINNLREEIRIIKSKRYYDRYK